MSLHALGPPRLGACSFVHNKKRRLKGRTEPPLGGSKVPVNGLGEGHVLSVAADRDIISRGSLTLFVGIVLHTAAPG